MTFARMFTTLAVLLASCIGSDDQHSASSQEVGDFRGTRRDAGPGSNPAPDALPDAPLEPPCETAAIACPITEPPPPEWVTCNDLVSGWVFDPESHPDLIDDANGYSSQEVDSHQPNDWFKPFQLDTPYEGCCTAGEVLYSYAVAGQITCNPPWVLGDGYNEAAVTFSILVDSSTICGKCFGPIIPRPPLVIKQMSRPPGAAPPPAANVPVPVPPGTKAALPPPKVVPGSRPTTAPADTGTAKSALSTVSNKPVLTHSPINGTKIGTTNDDYDLTGHKVVSTFFSGNREKHASGKANAQWNQDEARAAAAASTNLASKQLGLFIQNLEEFVPMNRFDLANRIEIGPTQVQIGGKYYSLSGLDPAEAKKQWDQLSASFAKTNGNYVGRAKVQGVAKCWLEGASTKGSFYQAEWPELLRQWETRFAAGPDQGKRMIVIEYMQGGRWHTYDGTNPPKFAP
jgi:hypothetical protein